MDKNQDELLNDALQEAIAVIGDTAGSEHIDMLRAFYTREMQACFQVVREVAGFEMTLSYKNPF